MIGILIQMGSDMSISSTYFILNLNGKDSFQQKYSKLFKITIAEQNT